jgi:hypothetical protein
MSRFKIDHMLDLDDRGVYVFAYHIDSDEFNVTSSSTLGGAPLCEYLGIPRKLKPDGGVDLSCFAFRLANREDGALFSIGEVVSLEP